MDEPKTSLKQTAWRERLSQQNVVFWFISKLSSKMLRIRCFGADGCCGLCVRCRILHRWDKLTKWSLKHHQDLMILADFLFLSFHGFPRVLNPSVWYRIAHSSVSRTAPTRQLMDSRLLRESWATWQLDIKWFLCEFQGTIISHECSIGLGFREFRAQVKMLGSSSSSSSRRSWWVILVWCGALSF